MNAMLETSRAWSLESVRQLLELARERVPASIISLKLKRSEREIHAKASELGVALQIG